MSQPNIFVRLFRLLWGAFDGVRKILHFIVLLGIFSVLVIVLAPDTPQLPQRAALVVQPIGQLTEQLAGTPVDRALEEATDQAVPQTLVRDVIEAIDLAAADDGIEAIYLRAESISGASLPSLQAIAAAILRFRETGKPVIAYGGYYSQPGYYLAAHADEVLLDPSGIVIADGYSSYRNYYVEAIEKLSIDWNIFKVGSHKSYVEPYMRTDMSPEDREFRQRMVDGLWSSYTAAVEQVRGLDEGTLQSVADSFADKMAEQGGDFARTALAAGLVDGLATALDARDRMIEEVGTAREDDTTFAQINMDDYLATSRALDISVEADNVVGIVVAVGSIVDGSAAPGTIGGDSTARLLRAARADDKIKAVVLRVDSGGGSAFASDVIRSEILALQAAGKPVIASMGGVAASGGYWISMSADQIVAESDTITGSIGILSMLPTYERTLGRLGVYTDGVGSTTLAGALRVDKDLTPQVRRILQLNIEDGYRDFVGTVAESRGMTFEEVDAVAQGKVWLGREAIDIGLIDTLGTLDDAVQMAADAASLERDYSTRYIEPQLSEEEKLLMSLLDGSARLGISAKWLAPRYPRVGEFLMRAEQGLGEIAKYNDPMHRYATCFCEVR